MKGLLALFLIVSLATNGFFWLKLREASTEPIGSDAAPCSSGLREIAQRLGVSTPDGKSEVELMSDIRLCLDAAELGPREVLSKKTIGELSRYADESDGQSLKSINDFSARVVGRRVLVLPEK